MCGCLHMRSCAADASDAAACTGKAVLLMPVMQTAEAAALSHAHLPPSQVFRDKEGRRVSKEEYMEQQAAAKKKAQYDSEAQVGGREEPGGAGLPPGRRP